MGIQAKLISAIVLIILSAFFTYRVTHSIDEAKIIELRDSALTVINHLKLAANYVNHLTNFSSKK